MPVEQSTVRKIVLYHHTANPCHFNVKIRIQFHFGNLLGAQILPFSISPHDLGRTHGRKRQMYTVLLQYEDCTLQTSTMQVYFFYGF